MVQLQSLRRHAAAGQTAVRVPERLRLDRVHVERARGDLVDRLGREPSDAELTSHAGLSVDRLRRVRLAHPGEFAEGTFAHPDAEDGGPAMPGRPVGPAADPAADPWVRFVYGGLAAEDQLVLEHSLGMHGKPVLPKKRIARMLGVSPAAVTQRAERLNRLLEARHAVPGGLFT
jgi:hypothetical protein